MTSMKASMPFRFFLAGKRDDHNRSRLVNSTNDSRVPSNTSQVQRPMSKEAKEVQKIWELQQILLQKLAKRENIAKGFAYQHRNHSLNSHNIDPEVSLHSSALEADIEGWKREMPQVLYAMWNQHSKKSCYLSR
jgi:hypothetical protein